MKRIVFLSLFVFVNIALQAQKSGINDAQTDYARFVRPLVGTDFHGHTFPGATVPFGAVQLSPDTRLDGWDGCSAYHYSDNVIYGFSHTHLSGTGCSDYGDILLMPFSGTPSVVNSEYCSPFSHKNEIAEAGYYSVLLDKYNIKVELTCSKHVGVHRYTYNNQNAKGVIIDLKHRDMVLNSVIKYDKNNKSIIGLRDSKAWNEHQRLNFSILFSQNIEKIDFYVDDKKVDSVDVIQGTNCKAVVYFSEDCEKVVAKVALSTAAQNLDDAKYNQAEIIDFDFDKVHYEARQCWNRELGKIVVETEDETLKENFYTALYHCFISPNIFTDLNGKYRGHDGLVYSAKNDNKVYTVFSLWDTYRALHPLLTLIDRQRTKDFIYTFMRNYEQGGVLPVWELAAYETWCMIGYHSVSVIYDAYQKGILNDYTEYEKYQLLQAMVASAKLNKLGRPELARYGYVPADKEHESVSKTLEYAYDDWCIAQLAKDLGQDDVYNEFMKRAQSYKNVLDPAGFMHAKANGAFIQPFDPTEINNHYTEANCWQYSTYVPHDFNTYVDLIGGSVVAERFLDTLFGSSSVMSGRNQSDVTGLIGQYAHGNEPSHHAAYLYNYLGKPWKTQEMVNKILYTLYTPEPDGLCGNEDCGQMSAWYVMSSIGFYPVCPGDNKYIIGSPVFDKVTIHLENGKQFVITTKNRTRESCYVQSATLDGSKFNRSYITYDELKDGGQIDFVMGLKPSKKWGVGKGNLPENRIEATTTIVPVIVADKQSFPDEMTFDIQLYSSENKTDKNFVYPAQTDKIFYTLDGSTPLKSKEHAYNGPVTIKENTHVKAVSFNPQTGFSPIVEADFYKFAQDQKVTLNAPYEEMYPASGDNAVLDGIRGSSNFRLGGWQGYYGIDFDATIDLNKVKEIESVSASFLQDTRAWVVFPTEMTVEISDDNVDFIPYGTYVNRIPADDYEAQTQLYTVEKKAECRYVHIKAKTFGTLPDWHMGAGGKSHTFIDEIIVK